MIEAIAGLTLQQVSHVGQLGVMLWLFLLALLIGWRLLVEGEAFEGLLGTRWGDPIEPDRLQLLLATGGGVVTYVMASVEAVQAHATRMPDAPSELLTIMAASQAVYLGGKISRTRS